MTTELSKLEQMRFGIVTARSDILSGKDLKEAESFCKDNGVALSIARIPVELTGTIQEMEKSGYLLMDTIQYFRRDLINEPVPADPKNNLIRPVKQDEVKQVAEIARLAFKGYRSHYHADPRLDNGKCDDTYTDWAERSCTDTSFADTVLVSETEKSVSGFATLRLNSNEEGEGVLFGVAPFAKGKGIYTSFIISSMEWFRSRNVKSMIVSTQITNLAVQKVWTRNGFVHYKSRYTFHKWFQN